MQNLELKIIQNLKREVKEAGNESLLIIEACKHRNLNATDLFERSVNINRRCHNMYDDLRYLEGEIKRLQI